MNIFRSLLCTVVLIPLASGTLLADTVPKATGSETNNNLTGSHASFAAKLRENLPQGWTMQVQEGAVPSGHDTRHGTGTAAIFTGMGESYPIGRRAGPKQKEQFTLWLMPLDYIPEAAPIDMKRAYNPCPENLGSNTTCQVYCLTSVESQPTWAKWKQDIKRILELDAKGKPDERKASHLQCSDVKECALLGVLNTPKGPVYKLKLSVNDPKTYFVQAGDYVGDYLLDDQETTTEGKPKVILKKGTEAITLSEQDKKK